MKNPRLRRGIVVNGRKPGEFHFCPIKIPGLTPGVFCKVSIKIPAGAGSLKTLFSGFYFNVRFKFSAVFPVYGMPGAMHNAWPTAKRTTVSCCRAADFPLGPGHMRRVRSGQIC